MAGGAQIGHRYYVLDSTGTIDCYDYATASTCGTYTAFSTPGNVLAGAEDRVESFDGRYLFAEMGNKSGVHAYISCVDLSTGNRCPGYPFTASVTNNPWGRCQVLSSFWSSILTRRHRRVYRGDGDQHGIV